MRVHKNHIEPTGQILLIAFRNHGNPNDPGLEPGMSTDWQKYSSPEECRERASDFGKDPERYEVIQMNVGQIRGIPNQRVEHTPIHKPDNSPPHLNRAHTDVFGEKDEEARLELFKLSLPAFPFGL
jgi:hypothetical protein